MHWLHHRWHICEHKVCSVTHKICKSSTRHVSSFKDSSVLLNNWEVNFTKVKSFLSLAHYLWWKPKIYIRTLSKCTKRWKQSSTIKQLLQTLFLAIKICTGFITDGMSMNTLCAVSPANHLRAVADAFRPLRLISTTEQLRWFIIL